MENAVKLCQPRLAVQGLGGHAQAFEVVENVGLNALQAGLGGLEAVGVDADYSDYREIPIFLASYGNANKPSALP